LKNGEKVLDHYFTVLNSYYWIIKLRQKLNFVQIYDGEYIVCIDLTPLCDITTIKFEWVIRSFEFAFFFMFFPFNLLSSPRTEMHDTPPDQTLAEPLPVVLDFRLMETTGLPVFSPQHYFGSPGAGESDPGDDFLTPSKP
jgi:hypothetical protein